MLDSKLNWLIDCLPNYLTRPNNWEQFFPWVDFDPMFLSVTIYLLFFPIKIHFIYETKNGTFKNYCDNDIVQSQFAPILIFIRFFIYFICLIEYLFIFYPFQSKQENHQIQPQEKENFQGNGQCTSPEWWTSSRKNTMPKPLIF